MKRLHLPAAFLLLLSALNLTGQTTPQKSVQPNQAQQLVFAGLRTAAAQGAFNAVQADAAGNLFLLLNQGDGIRILKTDATAQTLLAQTTLGAAGDIGLALALDSAGNVFVTGTTTSSALTSTSGAAIPTRTDTSTNSFVAKFDTNLNPVFVTFTGGSRIAASAIAATADAVFVTGSLFTSTLPVTDDGIQQSPAPGSSQNGFVEKFSSDGTALLYATYLTGAQGNTAPASIAADASDNAYIVGSTTASGYPTVAALVPNTLTSPSGFLTKLTPAGDGITLSTFIPGPGLTSITLSSDAQSLILTGSVALGQFPIQTVLAPIASPLTYQSLFTLPLDASSVTSSILLAPGSSSFASTTPSGAVWIAETLTAPLIPTPTLASLGTGLALRINQQSQIDQSARFGGLPNANPTFASLPLTLTSIALSPTGEPLIAGYAQPTASSSLLATETYDLPLIPTAVLPSTVHAAQPTSSTCTGSLCPGSAAYLARLNPTVSAPTLALSADDNPFLILRNLGSASAQTLALTATAATISTNCPQTLSSAAECNILLSPDGSNTPATLTATAANATPATATVPTPPIPLSTIVFSPRELDFGVQTSTSPAALRTFTISNLGPTPQSFASGIPTTPKSPTPPFVESSSDCTGTSTLHTLAPAATCHITIALTASSAASSDALLNQYWQVGPRSLLLTAYTQAASLSLSSPTIDFGTQYKNGLRLPRFLHLSNASSISLPHTHVTLPIVFPFTLTDTCPSLIPSQSVCTIRVDYVSFTVPSKDSVLLSLDPDGLGHTLTVTLTGQSLPQPGVGGTIVNPNLSVTPSTLTFATAVPVTSVSASSQTVSITNTGASPFSLTLALTGDFSQQSSCPTSLPGGQTCAVAITFVPSQPGTRQGLLAVTAGTGFSPAYVSLTGTATAILPANNGTLDSGSTILGEPVTAFYKISQPFSSLTAASTGPYTVAFIQDTGFGPGSPSASAFSATTTASCPNCYLAIRFNPTATGPQPGTLTLTSTPSGSPYILSLTGTGLPVSGLQLTPLTQSFGSIPVNSTTAPFLFTLTNLTPGGAPVTLLAPTLTGDYLFSTTPAGGQSCTGTLAYASSCLLNVQFAPTATGTRPGALTLTSSSGDTVTATLTATATPDPGLSFNPTALIFSNVPGPTSTQQSILLTNTGTATLALATPTVTSPAFTPTSTCTTLAPTQTCTLTVTFTPTTAPISDTLILPVTATTPGGTVSTTTYTVPLSGTYTSTSAGLLITPAQSDFGPTPILTQGGLRQLTLQNLTTHAYTLALTLPRQFALIGPPCTTLAPTSTCTVAIQFLPLTNAQITGSLLVTATPSDTSPILTSIAYLQGFGTPSAGPLTLSTPPSSPIQSNVLNFGQITSGQTGSIAVTLTNRNPLGSPAITIRRATSAPPFLSFTACPTALAPAQSCIVTLTYVPSNQVPSGTSSPASTTDTGLLTIESDASSSPNLLNLTGQAGPLAVSNPTGGSALRAFTLSQGSLTFPSTQVGDTSPAQTVTLTNTGLATLHITSATVPSDFSLQSTCTTVLAGATCTLTIAATPQTPGPHITALAISSDSTSSLDFISLLATSTANALTLSPTSLDFGSLQLAQTSTLPVTVTNTSASPILFSGITATGDYTPTGTCPPSGSPLLGGATCTIRVAFTPTQTGTRPGTLSIASSASTNPLTIPLTGIGIQSALTVTPSALAFGSIVLGGSANQTLTLANTGSADITTLAFALAAPDYSITNPCPVTTLTPGQTCTLQLTFTPTALGPRPGTLTITSSDKSSPLTLPITGTGLSSGSFTLTVNNAASATVTTTAPFPAHYTLTLTPTGGYSGAVALTCAPIVPAPYGSCSLQASTLTLSGSPLTSTATLNTVTGIPTSAILAPLTLTAFLLLPLSRRKQKGRPGTVAPCLRARLHITGLWPCLRARLQACRTLPQHRPALAAEVRLFLFFTLTALTLALTSCGGGKNPNVQLTPPGSYQYTVTASSTSGPTITQTVTLNLIVQ